MVMQNLGGGGGVNKVPYGLCENSEYAAAKPPIKFDHFTDFGILQRHQCEKYTHFILSFLLRPRDHVCS